MTASRDIEKAFEKIQHLFMIKINKLQVKRNFLSLIKGIYKKPTAIIILNSERLNAFSLKSRTTQRYPLSLLLFNIVLEILPR